MSRTFHIPFSFSNYLKNPKLILINAIFNKNRQNYNSFYLRFVLFLLQTKNYGLNEVKHVKITPEIVKEHNLKPEEYERIKELIGREPNINELGIFSVMWSEHCSYKHSKPLIKTLPTQGKHILVGPGENAGIVDIGDNMACVFKIESHNHPSAIEPYQGAATGVGGILRDIFTMGARPVALLDSLRFGKLDNEKTKHLFDGVVAGIAGYGNCVGVPTVAGEVYFDDSYQSNILVNAMCVGIVKHSNITKAVATQPGYKLLYYGNTTGRDGVHGASFASAELEKDKEQRSAVQVGDPFTEKLILEATLELIEGKHVEAIQDMGAAGLTSSSTEMGGRGVLWIRLYLDDIPKRADDLTPYERLLSESQERMLAVVKPEKVADAQKVLDKWELYSTVVGEVVSGDHFQVFYHDETVVDLPISAIIENVPQYKLPVKRSQYLDGLKPVDITGLIKKDYTEDLLKLLYSPNIAGKRWIYEQYDHQVQTNTVIRPGESGAAVVRVEGTKLGLAMTTDCSGRYCYLDPYNGAAMAVAEAARNIACVGATPLAITNNLNFANPEKTDIYFQLHECIRGIKDACTALNTPVTGGNASLYNESGGKPIYPTPTIGMIGAIKDYSKCITRSFKNADEMIYLLGETGEKLDGSEYLYVIHNQIGKNCPEVNLEQEKLLINCLLELTDKELLSSASDISEGGLAVALVKSAFQQVGAEIKNETGMDDVYFLFSETPGRAIISFKKENEKAVREILKAFQIKNQFIGITKKDVIIGSGIHLNISDAIHVYETGIPDRMKK